MTAAPPDLWPHHAATIENLTSQMAADPAVLGLILAGSLAHGFATAESDVDVVIVVAPDELARLAAADRLHYNATDVVTYDGGYVDGKYVDLPGLRLVAERGSDPARYGYVGARVLFSREAGLAELLAEITRYPEAERASRIERFTAQLLGWRWYFGQGAAKGDPYLRTAAMAKVVLFSCRLVLAENSLLYPHHKWLLRVTEGAARRPAELMPRLRAMAADPWETTAADVEAHVAGLLEFYGIDRGAAERVWPTFFIRDSESAWITGPPPVDEL